MAKTFHIEEWSFFGQPWLVIWAMVMSGGITVLWCHGFGRYREGPRTNAFHIEEWSFVGQSRLVIWAMVMSGGSTVRWCHGYGRHR